MTVLPATSPVCERFEQQARELYGEGDSSHAITQAMELWLTQPQDLVVEAEETLNNLAYEQLETELERRYPGKCVVIAHGELQGIGNTFEEVKDLAPAALHRLVFRVGDVPPRERELGWQIERA